MPIIVASNQGQDTRSSMVCTTEAKISRGPVMIYLKGFREILRQSGTSYTADVVSRDSE